MTAIKNSLVLETIIMMTNPTSIDSPLRTLVTGNVLLYWKGERKLTLLVRESEGLHTVCFYESSVFLN